MVDCFLIGPKRLARSFLNVKLLLIFGLAAHLLYELVFFSLLQPFLCVIWAFRRLGPIGCFICSFGLWRHFFFFFCIKKGYEQNRIGLIVLVYRPTYIIHLGLNKFSHQLVLALPLGHLGKGLRPQVFFLLLKKKSMYLATKFFKKRIILIFKY